jgi:RecB family exonuclease
LAAIQTEGGSVKLNLKKLPGAGQELIRDEKVHDICHKLNVIKDRQSGFVSSIWEGDFSENKTIGTYLHKRFNAARFSPTQLEVYAHCPMIFFFERILNIEKEEIREAYLSPLDRGILIHEILFRFYSELTPEKQNLENLLKIAGEELSKISVSPGLLWELDKEHFTGNEDMRGVLSAFLAYDKEMSSQYSTQAKHFELSFGRPIFSAEAHDPLSTETPFIYRDKKETFQFSGKIDRIEISPDGSLLIVDYKTGNLPTLRDMWDGKKLQLPLYLLAVYNHLKSTYPKLKMAGGAFYGLGRENEIEKKIVFMDNKRKIVDQELFKSARFPNEKFKIDTSPASLKDFLEKVMDHAVGYIREIQNGIFTHTPDQSNCKSRNGKLCEYLPVCRVSWMKQAHLRSQSSTDKA